MKIKKVILIALCFIMAFPHTVNADGSAWKESLITLMGKYPCSFDEETRNKNFELYYKYFTNPKSVNISGFSIDAVFPFPDHLQLEASMPFSYNFYDLDFDGIPEAIIDYGGLESGVGWRIVYKFSGASYEQIKILSGGEHYEHLYINSENKIVSVNPGSTQVLEIKNNEIVYGKYIDSSGNTTYNGVEYSEIGTYTHGEFFHNDEGHLPGIILADLMVIPQFECPDVIEAARNNLYSPKTGDDFLTFFVIIIPTLTIFAMSLKLTGGKKWE